jgi:hypothetical protein
MGRKAYSGSNARELTLQLALCYNPSLRLAQSIGRFLYANQIGTDRVPHTPARVWVGPLVPTWSRLFFSAFVLFLFLFPVFLFFFFSLVFCFSFTIF